MDIVAIKSAVPSPDRVAADLYGIVFRNNAAQCAFPDRHAHGDRNHSLRYDGNKNRIFCASQGCFGEKGADAIELVRIMDETDFAGAVKKLSDHYGLHGINGTNGHGKHDGEKVGRESGQPIPADRVRAKLEAEGWRLAAIFHFSDSLQKIRWEHQTRTQPSKAGKPDKSFRWEHRGQDGKWYSGDGGQAKPIYTNRPFRDRDQLGVVLGVEGEAKADAVADLDIPAFSFRELTPENAAVLVDLDICLWPDNDQAGSRYVARVVEIISAHARSVRTIKPPAELPESGDVIDYLALHGPDRQRIEQLIAAAVVVKHPKITVAGIGSIRSYNSQRIVWVCAGFLAAGTLGLLTSEPGEGKTTVTTALGYAVSAGVPFAGLETDQRPVLVLDRENPLSVTVERFDRLGIQDGPEFIVWGGWAPEEAPAPNSPVILDWIQSCRKPPLVVVDSLVSFLEGGNENDATEMRAVMHGFRRLADAGATILILHHSGKGETTREYRGSSDIKAAIDVGYHLTNLGDKSRLSLLRLKAFKSRFSVMPELVLRYEDGCFSTLEGAARPTNYELLVGILKGRPGVRGSEFESLAQDKGIARDRARSFLTEGVQGGKIQVTKGAHNTRQYTWTDGRGVPDGLL